MSDADPTFYDPYALEVHCSDRHHRLNRLFLDLKAKVEANTTAAARIERDLDRGLDRINETIEKKTQVRPGLRFWLPVVVTLALAAGGWVWYIARVPSRVDVARMIREQSPYREDRPLLHRAVQDVDRATRGLDEAARDLARLVQLTAEQKERIQLFWDKDWPLLIRRLERLEDRTQRKGNR